VSFGASPPVPRLPSPVEELRDERIAERGIRLFLKRDDLIHPEIPGNKWRKLKYNLLAAKELGLSTLLTFGGPYSNHLRATAAAGELFGFSTIGVVRGEEHLPLNPSLEQATSRGMRLTYLDRTTYRRKNDEDVIEALRRRYGECYVLPEGGSNPLGVRGCAELPAELDLDFDVICCPVGSGGTLAGIAVGLAVGRRALGFSVLRGGQFLTREVARLQQEASGAVSEAWSIEYDYHFGGFAKSTAELRSFIDDFEDRHKLRLDRVYVAKMMSGIFDLAADSAKLPTGSVVVAVVTGPADD